MRAKGEGSLFKDSQGRWVAVIELPQRGGIRKRKFIRSVDKAKVLAKRKKVLDELDQYGELAADSTSVKQWFTYWLNEVVVKDVRPATFNGYRSVVNQHIIPGLGERTKLTKITARHVRAVHDHVLSADLSSTYALNAHRVMSASFETAMKEGRLRHNPAKLVNAPRKAVRSLDVLDLDESIRLLAAVAHMPDGARWATSLLTGARRGEVIGLEVDRVTDFIDLSWQLQRIRRAHDGKPIVPSDYEYRHLTGGLYLTRPKSKAGWRIIPLVEPLQSILARHIEESPPNPWGLVFTNNGRPRDPDQDTKAWNSVLDQTFGRDRHVRLHDLRHSAVDLLYLAGVPEDIIQEIVGHSTRTMTRAYKARGNMERLRAAMTQMSELLSSPETSRTPEIGA